MTKTRKMLIDLQARGHIVGDPETFEKTMHQQQKMVALRFYNDMIEVDEGWEWKAEQRFLKHWRPIRECVESKLS